MRRAESVFDRRSVARLGRILAAALALSTARATGLPAQEAAPGPKRPFQDALLEKLAGDWEIMRAMRDKEVRNRASARWILGHQFLELRMTDVASPPAYEALVLLGEGSGDGRYVVYWCDTWGGPFSATGVGRRAGDTIEFELHYPDGPFFNTFSWDARGGTWTSRMENTDRDGYRSLFAVDTYRRP